MLSSAPPLASTPRDMAERAFSRAAGADLIEGNAVELLIDAEVHFERWLAAIAGARRHVLLENYIIRNDEVGRRFRNALVERARAGVFVAVIYDWMGSLGVLRASFWNPLREAGGQVRVFNPPQLGKPFGWLSRDHRKVLVVDGHVGFLSGVCLSAKWLGDPARGVAPWRDTGVAIHGPGVMEIQHAFAHSWDLIGEPLPALGTTAADTTPAGDVALRIIATRPASAGMYRLDQQIAAMARRSLWLTDAYFVGIAPYVQALASAARDGVDVRLLVPGSSDLPMLASISRSGYRPLLQAGVRVFEWNGSMLHAKTAVADGQWARVGSSNLNIASWLNNREIDVAVEDAAFAKRMAEQYEMDLENATEIVLKAHPRHRGQRIHSNTSRAPRPRGRNGSSGRVAASALRIANTFGAVLTQRRELGDTETGPLLGVTGVLLLIAVIGTLWPAVIAWPLALFCAWLALNLGIRSYRMWRKRRGRFDP